MGTFCNEICLMLPECGRLKQQQQCKAGEVLNSRPRACACNCTSGCLRTGPCCFKCSRILVVWLMMRTALLHHWKPCLSMTTAEFVTRRALQALQSGQQRLCTGAP